MSASLHLRPSTIRIFWMLAILLAPYLFASPVKAEEKLPAKASLIISFFYSSACPHCHRQMELMRPLADNNPELKINFYDVNLNRGTWKTYLEEHAIGTGAVPRTQIGDLSFIGYSESAESLLYLEQYKGYQGNPTQIIKAIEKELGHKVQLGSLARPEAVDRILPPYWPLVVLILYLSSYLLLRKRLKNKERMRLWIGGLVACAIISLFILLGVLPDARIQAWSEKFPYPFFVFFIALADGFNPCAFTVLIILLSLLTHTRGRRDMAIIGLTFNELSHAGKIYSLLAGQITERVYAEVPGLAEVNIRLDSQIGSPINKPAIASAQLIALENRSIEKSEAVSIEMVKHELAAVAAFSERLIRGELPIC
jgi:thiol-disulfide isomerase/thioredoxin